MCPTNSQCTPFYDNIFYEFLTCLSDNIFFVTLISILNQSDKLSCNSLQCSFYLLRQRGKVFNSKILQEIEVEV